MNKSYVKEILSWLMYLGGGIIIALILVNYVFRLTVVKGESMMDTLNDEQVLYIDKLFYRISGIKRGDIVICNYPGDINQKFIKRVIGMPGETIYIKNSVVYINGVPGLDLWQGDHTINDMHEVVIPKDCYFVMGDNRSNSRDSRDKSVGPLKEEMILGKAGFSIYPLDTFGSIEFNGGV